MPKQFNGATFDAGKRNSDFTRKYWLKYTRNDITIADIINQGENIDTNMG